MSNDCDYCDSEFSSEKSYLKHLRSEHYDDLSSIDKRRVDSQLGSPEESRSWLAPAAVIAVVAIVGGALYLGFTGGGGSDLQIDGDVNPQLGAAHDHVPISVVVQGEQVDFSQSKYQLVSKKVHFEGGDGSTLHLHAAPMTVEYALEVHGFGVKKNELTYGGKTYVDGQNAEVIYRVNGKEVDPTKYVLQDGDTLEVIVK